MDNKNQQQQQQVRLISWKDGFHIYAKVGDADVVDEYGNQKWSTRKEAEDAAKWFIENSDRYENCGK